MEKQLHILYTSDTHGHMFPASYATREPEASGLLGCIHQYRKDGNTLVIDGGDTLQGSPYTQYLADHREWGQPVAAVFNAGGYDYITLGNHDFNYGYDHLRTYLEALDARCICANVTDRTGQLPITASVIHTLENGLQVGITGIVTDHVKVWESAENIANFHIEPPFPAAQRELERLRGTCDITLCIYHGGFECDIPTGRQLEHSGENVGYRICQELTFDILLTAHQHMPLDGQLLGGTYVLQLPAYAAGFAQVTAAVTEDGVSVSSQMIPAGLTCDPVLAERLLPYENAVQTWLDQPVGELTQAIPPLSKLDCALHGSQVAALFNQVQLDVTGADFSCASLGNQPIQLSRKVTVREILASYQFLNTLVVLEVDEQVLRAVLERCAEYFTLEKGEVRISQAFLHPKVEHYNYDFFAGFTYSFDLTQPVGSRVGPLLHHGKPLEQKTYTLCTNSYRATGTGGYDALAGCPVLRRLEDDVPELIIRYIRRHSPVEVPEQASYTIHY